MKQSASEGILERLRAGLRVLPGAVLSRVSAARRLPCHRTF